MIEIIPNWHPTFVHFPIALTITSTFCFLVGATFPELRSAKELVVVSRWCIWLGGAFAIPAVLFGWLAYNSVAHDELSHQAMTLHRNWAFPTAGLIILASIVSFFFRRNWGKKLKLFTALVLISLSGLISVTGWLGAESVYRFGVGVLSMPAITEPKNPDLLPHGHEHSH